MVLNWKKYIAEFIGTFVLVFFACGTVLSSGGNIVAVALAFGLTIVAMAYTFGNISGCHINPAVSFAMFLNGKLSKIDFIGYICSQFLGGIVGAAFLTFFFESEQLMGCSNHYWKSSDNEILPTLILEIILTFVFVLVILVVTSKPELSNIAGLLIGLTLTFVHLLGIGITGTSVNPARSFGPAICAGGDSIEQVWAFILAPMIGAAIAAFTFSGLFKKENTL